MSKHLQFNITEKKAVLGIGGIFALRMLGLFMIIPIFAIYGQNYQHATPFLIGLAIGIYGLGQSLFQIPVGFLADKYPRKPIILIGLAVFALGGVICATATDIYQVIIGRFLAGSGAISAALMALLADMTREENRTKAMASMGLTIAISIIMAFGLGPILSKSLDISGLFWLTVVSAFLAMGLLALIPNPVRLLKHHVSDAPVKQQLLSVLKVADFNRLHLAIFILHLTMTASFTLLPNQFSQVLDLAIDKQGFVYLSLLLLGFLIAVPLIIIAEKKRQMRSVFLISIIALIMGLGVLTLIGENRWGLFLGLAIYYIGFNSLEATIPSWISKKAPVANKSTVMGLNASSQFFGAFIGGMTGGLLLNLPNGTAWLVLAVITLIAFFVIIPIQAPPYLTSLTIHLPKDQQELSNWLQQIGKIDGIDEIVIIKTEKIAYLKLDKTALTDDTRHKLSQLIQQPLDI